MDVIHYLVSVVYPHISRQDHRGDSSRLSNAIKQVVTRKSVENPRQSPKTKAIAPSPDPVVAELFTAPQAGHSGTENLGDWAKTFEEALVTISELHASPSRLPEHESAIVELADDIVDDYAKVEKAERDTESHRRILDNAEAGKSTIRSPEGRKLTLCERRNMPPLRITPISSSVYGPPPQAVGHEPQPRGKADEDELFDQFSEAEGGRRVHTKGQRQRLIRFADEERGAKKQWWQGEVQGK